MAWPRNDWTSGEAVPASQLNAIGDSFRTWQGNVNGGAYDLSNLGNLSFASGKGIVSALPVTGDLSLTGHLIVEGGIANFHYDDFGNYTMILRGQRDAVNQWGEYGVIAYFGGVQVTNTQKLKKLVEFFQNGGVYLSAPNADPGSGALVNGGIVLWLDEAGNTLRIRAKYSNGTSKTASIALT